MGGSRPRIRPSAGAGPVTVRDAATRLGVGYSTVKQWIYGGQIRTTRTPGGHHRVPVAEIDRMLADTRADAAVRPSTAPGPLASISGRNRLRGIVEEVRTEGLLAQIRLRIGDQLLTAVITRDAAEELRLRRGVQATAVIKSTEVMMAREAADERPDPPRRRRSVRNLEGDHRR